MKRYLSTIYDYVKQVTRLDENEETLEKLKLVSESRTKTQLNSSAHLGTITVIHC